ncbi:MAG: AAA family ATPase [Desulfuromonadales bacterium]|nr:AAA family ATPase [Desulfuromonadales bacterium]
MYLDFYGLTEQPFSITPNPRYLFLSKHHREVFAHLLFGIRRHAGFIEVTGEVGTGKTTVLRTLFLELEQEEARIAYIFNPCLSAPDLLRTVNREFGLAHQAPPPELHAALNTFLLQENAAGRTVVLVIDEAQNLAVDVLEQIRLLSNLETETDKLIQIVLVGQPELGALLEKQELRQLSQRITVRYHLQSMDAEDTAAYIEHRLGVAGWNRGHLFSEAAMKKIYQLTRGNPRMVNILCDRALLIGYADSIERIDLPEIRRANQEVRRHQADSSFSPVWLWLLLIIPLFALALWALPRSEKEPLPETTILVNPQIDPFTHEVLPFLRQTPTEVNRRNVVNSLLALWGGKPVAAAATLEDALNLSRDQKFVVARLQGDLAALLRLRLPLILEVVDAAELRYLLVTGQTAGGVTVVLDNGRTVTISPSQLAPYWQNRAYLLWKNPLNLSLGQGPFQNSREIVALQSLLSNVGKDVPASGRYDDLTRAAIRSFQHEQQLPVDGIAGMQTLIALYRESRLYGYPIMLTGGGEQ